MTPEELAELKRMGLTPEAGTEGLHAIKREGELPPGLTPEAPEETARQERWRTHPEERPSASPDWLPTGVRNWIDTTQFGSEQNQLGSRVATRAMTDTLLDSLGLRGHGYQPIVHQHQTRQEAARDLARQHEDYLRRQNEADIAATEEAEAPLAGFIGSTIGGTPEMVAMSSVLPGGSLVGGPAATRLGRIAQQMAAGGLFSTIKTEGDPTATAVGAGLGLGLGTLGEAPGSLRDLLLRRAGGRQNAIQIATQLRARDAGLTPPEVLTLAEQLGQRPRGVPPSMPVAPEPPPPVPTPRGAPVQAPSEIRAEPTRGYGEGAPGPQQGASPFPAEGTREYEGSQFAEPTVVTTGNYRPGWGRGEREGVHDTVPSGVRIEPEETAAGKRGGSEEARLAAQEAKLLRKERPARQAAEHLGWQFERGPEGGFTVSMGEELAGEPTQPSYRSVQTEPLAPEPTRPGVGPFRAATTPEAFEPVPSEATRPGVGPPVPPARGRGPSPLPGVPPGPRPTRLEEFGTEIREANLPGTDLERSLAAREQAERAGRFMGEAQRAAVDANGNLLDAADVEAALRRDPRLRDLLGSTQPEIRAAAEDSIARVRDAMRSGGLTPARYAQVRDDLSTLGKAGRTGTPTIQQQAHLGARSALVDAVDDAVENRLGVAEREAYRAARRRFGAMASVRRASLRESVRETTNRQIPLTRYLSTLAGLMRGGPGLGLALGVGNEALRGGEHVARARLLEALAGLRGSPTGAPVGLGRHPFLGGQGGAARDLTRGSLVSAVQHFLRSHREPEYRRATTGAETP